MKREVFCAPCAKAMRELFPTDTPYPGEHVKFVQGKSAIECRCDQCGEYVEPGEDLCAFSAWTDYGGMPYFPWENEYLLGDHRTRGGS